MAGQDDQDAPQGSNAVLSWYDKTRPMFIDLVGDYAGKELFLVEGDSLLRVCFEDERIDFQGKPPRACSGLHSSLGLSLAAKVAISVAKTIRCASWYRWMVSLYHDSGSERVRWVELVPGPANLTEHHSTGLLLIISDGFQLLHAVYVVERFLENLVKRHCQFHIAFFEGNSL
jgi:hypothetical protein